MRCFMIAVICRLSKKKDVHLGCVVPIITSADKHRTIAHMKRFKQMNISLQNVTKLFVGWRLWDEHAWGH